MTNKIAIEYLKDMLASAEANSHVPDMAEHAEALDMAIEALSNSQNQSDSLIRTSANSVSATDVIYRQQAIDALMVWEEDSVWNDECLKHRGKSYAPSDVIKELPSAHLVNDSQGFSQGDYISRLEATSIPILPKEHRKIFKSIDDAFETGWNEALSCVNMLPSAQPEQRTGEWIHDGSDWTNRWICSKCGYKHFLDKSNYCPECGSYNGGKNEV